MSRQDINRANNCKGFALSDLGDVETGKPYKPQDKKRKPKEPAKQQITFDEIG
jgi:hypothetical protein